MHQKVGPEGRGRQVIHAACAVCHVTQHQRLTACEPGREGGGREGRKKSLEHKEISISFFTSIYIYMYIIGPPVKHEARSDKCVYVCCCSGRVMLEKKIAWRAAIAASEKVQKAQRRDANYRRTSEGCRQWCTRT
jgi:hypothetical protein